jgi:hypothetical protein
VGGVDLDASYYIPGFLAPLYGKDGKLQLVEKSAKSTQFYLWRHLFLVPASGVDHLTRSLVSSILIG